MAITDTTTERIGDVVRVSVTSNLTAPVYFHWYVDGCWFGSTDKPSRSFVIPEDQQPRITVIDTGDEYFDGLAAATAHWSHRRVLWWVRSLDTDVAYYRIEQSKDSGAWTPIGRVPRNREQWSYEFFTDRLDDLSTYSWRVVPVDAVGNDGDPLLLGTERIVRRPDAPAVSASYSAGTRRVTFAEAE